MKLLTIGSFDVPHIGHAYLFKECERYADEVIVGVNSDEFIHEYKGKNPLFPYELRAELIAGLGYTVVKNMSAGRELIEQIEPDILAIGSDWARKDYYAQIDVDQDFMDKRNIAMLYIPRWLDISTTKIKNTILGVDPAAEQAWRRHHVG